MTKKRAKQQSEKMKEYLAKEKAAEASKQDERCHETDTEKEMQREAEQDSKFPYSQGIPEMLKTKRSMKSSFTIDNSEMFLQTKEGKLTNYTMRFQGGSKIEFWVEE